MSDGPGPQVPARPVPWGLLVGLAVLAAVGYAAFAAASDLHEVQRAAADFTPATIAVVLALVLLGYLFRAQRWQWYLGRLGAPVPFLPSVLTFLAGFALGVTPGKVGEAVKSYYLWDRARTPYTVSLPVFVAERVLDVAVLASLIVVGLFAVPAFDLRLGVVLLVVVVLSVVALRSRRAAALVLALVARMPLVRRLSEPLGRMHLSLRPLLGGRPLVGGLALGYVAWLLEPTALWLLARDLDLGLSWTACALVFCAASLAGALTMIPGGLAATEASMIGLLTLAFHVPLAPAAALTLAIRLTTLWFGVLVGALAIVALRWFGRSQPGRAEAAALPPQTY